MIWHTQKKHLEVVPRQRYAHILAWKRPSRNVIRTGTVSLYGTENVTNEPITPVEIGKIGKKLKVQARLSHLVYIINIKMPPNSFITEERI